MEEEKKENVKNQKVNKTKTRRPYTKNNKNV